jgi:hypothetical protein
VTYSEPNGVFGAHSALSFPNHFPKFITGSASLGRGGTGFTDLVSELNRKFGFDNFRYVFNNEHPDEGLNNQVPARFYHPSSVRLPRNLPEFMYPRVYWCDG